MHELARKGNAREEEGEWPALCLPPPHGDTRPPRLPFSAVFWGVSSREGEAARGPPDAPVAGGGGFCTGLPGQEGDAGRQTLALVEPTRGWTNASCAWEGGFSAQGGCRGGGAISNGHGDVFFFLQIAGAVVGEQISGPPPAPASTKRKAPVAFGGRSGGLECDGGTCLLRTA